MQYQLPMMTHYNGPSEVPHAQVAAIKTYREAVRACWALRKRLNMTKRQLAEECGLYAAHVTDYLAEADGKRELPARFIAAVEVSCSNRMISQWLAWQSSQLGREQAATETERRYA